MRLNGQDEEEQDELLPWPPPGGLPPGEDPFEKSSEQDDGPRFVLPDGDERREPWRMTRERAVTLSIILHLLLALGILLWPHSERPPLTEKSDPLGLMALMSATPHDDTPIPVTMYPSPGKAEKKPGEKPVLSDVNRKAHGGDEKLPPAPAPKSVAKEGIQDLDPGLRAREIQVAAEKMMRERNEAKKAEGGSLKDLAASASRPADSSRSLSGLPSALGSLTSEQVAQGAAATSGDQGAGYARQGGFADSGPLSFDTAGYEWGPYASEMIRKIKRNWDIPALARYGIKGRVTIRFFILKDGRVDGERIIVSSGIPPFDNAAFQAIAHASPFKPLPDDLGSSREGVTVTFFYNLDPASLQS